MLDEEEERSIKQKRKKVILPVKKQRLDEEEGYIRGNGRFQNALEKTREVEVELKLKWQCWAQVHE